MSDAKPLVEANQIWRRIDVHALARRFEDGAHEGDGRALAVGAGDMDHRRQMALRMIERGEDARHAIEPKVDALGMQREKPRQHGVDRRRARPLTRSRFGTSPEARALAPARESRLRRAGRRLGEEPAQSGDGGAQLVAMHDHVDHAVIAQIFGLLKAVRQLLADGLLDDARTGEADQGAGLGDVDVAEHRIGCGDAAGRRIGQHDDIGLARLAQALHRDGGARHLHQRQDAFLHARAARGGEQHERAALLHRGVETLDHRLARRHAERAAHEIEILHGDDGGEAVELAVAELDRVVQPGLAARVLEPVDIAALVAEFQRIDRHFRHGDVEPGFVVEHRFEPRHRAHAHVIVRARNDEQVGLDVLVEHELAGLRTFDPEIFRHFAPQDAADFRPHYVGDPVHCFQLVCPQGI